MDLFICGAVCFGIGVLFGVTIMCILNASSEADRQAGYK